MFVKSLTDKKRAKHRDRKKEKDVVMKRQIHQEIKDRAIERERDREVDR